MSRVLGGRVELANHVWTVWSEAPGVGCFWLVRRTDETGPVFLRARLFKGEWREAVDGKD